MKRPEPASLETRRGGAGRAAWALALLAAGLAAALTPALSRAQTAPVATAGAPAAESSPRCEAYLKVGGKQSKVTLLARTDSTVTFAMGTSIGQKHELAVEKVESCFFELELNYAALNKALAKRDWSAATRALYPTLAPTLPYLHLPNNNAIETVLEMANYMKSAAEAASLTAETDEAKARVKEQYKAAFAVYAQMGKAAWSSLGMVGRLKSYQMLMALEKPKTARQLFENLTAPAPGDRAYGLYWLVKAQLDIDKNEYRGAMQAAIKSLCFENKDVDTFPDALLISAQCYEELQEWHRARDVYYEVARIFPDTDWSERSVKRLRFIMAKGLTKEQEKSPIENVFFKLNEDINAKVKELFDALAAGKKTVYQEYAEKAEGDKAKDVEEKVTLDLDEPDK